MKKILFFFFYFILHSASAMAGTTLEFEGESQCKSGSTLCFPIPAIHTFYIPKTSIADIKVIMDPAGSSPAGVDDYCWDGIEVILNWIGNGEEHVCHDTLYPHLRSFAVGHITGVEPYYSPEKSGPIGLNAGNYELTVIGDRGSYYYNLKPCRYHVQLDYEMVLYVNEQEPNDDWNQLQHLNLDWIYIGTLGYAIEKCGKWDQGDGFKFNATAGEKYWIDINMQFDPNSWDKLKYHLPYLLVYDNNYKYITNITFDYSNPQTQLTGKTSFDCKVSGEYRIVLNTDIVYDNMTGGINLQQNLSLYDYHLSVSDDEPNVNVSELSIGRSPLEGGSTVPAMGTYSVESPYTIAAIPNADFAFVRWVLLEGDATIANRLSPETTVEIKSYARIYAEFINRLHPVVYVSSAMECAGMPACFSDIQDALDFIADASLSNESLRINLQEGTYGDIFDLHPEIDTVIEGGWNEDFTSLEGAFTIFDGTFYGRAEDNGSITLRNIRIKPSLK